MKWSILLCLIWSLPFIGYCQISGNQVYRKNNQSYTPKPQTQNNIRTTDSTLIVTAAVLLNESADYYELHLGVKETADNVPECNQKINARIAAVVEALNKMGVKDKSIYVDFISETKLYDFDIKDRVATEYLVGYEVRKNLIVQINDLERIDEIMVVCSEASIYDIIKVEYYIRDQEKIYDELFNEAAKIVDRRKARYERFSSIPLTGKSRIISDEFRVYHPKNNYQQYQEAFSNGTVVTSYSSGFVKKEIAKDKTFYYEGLRNNLPADKVIDRVAPKVGLQFYLELKIRYELARE
ncbi:MAG: SIMPL domain-containing protein [Bacteroidota bacterium]